MRPAASASPDWPVPADETAIRELAREILSRREYAAADPGALDTWIERILRMLSDFLEAVFRLHQTSPVLYWMFFAGLVLLSLLLLAHVVWTLRLALRTDEPAPDRPVRGRTRDLAAEAEALAAEGRTLEAAHRLMLASFELMARRAWIRLRPDEPNRVVRARLRGAEIPAGLASTLEGLVVRTEREWFRDRADDPALYAEWREAYGRLASA